VADDHMTEAEGRKKVLSLIKDITISMMATYSPDGFMHARPMAARTHENDADLWFFTSRASHTVSELRADPRVLLTYAEPSDQHYVSITGRGAIVDNRAKAKELWTEAMRTWFPKGVDDPDLILIKVHAERAQYWDAPSSAVVYAYGYVKARLTGERPDPGESGKVRL
jgi:general stress protein 26